MGDAAADNGIKGFTLADAQNEIYGRLDKVMPQKVYKWADFAEIYIDGQWRTCRRISR